MRKQIAMKLNLYVGLYLTLIFFLTGHSAQSQKLLEGKEEKESINWSKLKDWKDIVNAAKAANRYIFVDCYATWCIPCKKMDSLVLSKPSVSRTINIQFLALKLQMDTSHNDNPEVKSKYVLSNYIKKQNEITVLPTYLIFDNNGILVDKFEGAFFNANLFDSIIAKSLIVQYQYYPLRAEFEKGNSSRKDMSLLFLRAFDKKEKELVNRLVDTLFKKHLLEFSKVDYQTYSKGITSSRSEAYKYLVKARDSLNELVGNHFVDFVIFRVVSNELREKYKINNALNVSWKSLQRELAGLPISEQKGIEYKLRMENAKFRKEWNTFTDFAIKYCLLYHQKRSRLALNNILWDVFMNCNSQRLLKKAAKTANLVLRNEEGVFGDAVVADTYANLLYKSGDKREAIKWEQHSIILAKQLKDAMSEEVNSQTLEKMLKGVPTW